MVDGAIISPIDPWPARREGEVLLMDGIGNDHEGTAWEGRACEVGVGGRCRFCILEMIAMEAV